jgi:NAD(P)-dependent dehydrogenase (short-subunit alcohol dehydrogenase family)
MPIDMLILNAGIMALPELEQVNGLEKQFVTNHLGHFIVGNRLLPQVQAAAQGRVVVLTSSGYKWAPESGIEFDNLSGERDYKPNKMYGQSKLANHLYVRQLAKNLAGSTSTANSVHPGRDHDQPRPQLPAMAAGGRPSDRLDLHEKRRGRHRHHLLRRHSTRTRDHQRPLLCRLQPRIAGRQYGERRAGREAVGGIGGTDAALPAWV